MNSRQRNKHLTRSGGGSGNVSGTPNGNANGNGTRTPHTTPSSVYRSSHPNNSVGMSNGSAATNGVIGNGRLNGASVSSPHVPVTSAAAVAAYSISNGYVEYNNGANLMPPTSSSVVNLQQQYSAHAHAYTNGQNNGNGTTAGASFFAASMAASATGSPGPQFMTAAAAVHSAGAAAVGFGSPNGHIYQKFNHLAMSSPHSGLTNGRSLNGNSNGNGLSMSPSGMFINGRTFEKHAILSSNAQTNANIHNSSSIFQSSLPSRPLNPSPPMGSDGAGNNSPPYITPPAALSPELYQSSSHLRSPSGYGRDGYNFQFQTSALWNTNSYTSQQKYSGLGYISPSTITPTNSSLNSSQAYAHLPLKSNTSRA